jgi:predicted nucleic-acid-binding protein
LSLALDTNVVVRYLTWDDAAQAEAAAAVIESGETITISIVVLSEVAWVLKRTHRYSANEIANAFREVMTSRNVEVDRLLVEAGLQMLENGGDFADGVIEAEAVRSKSRQIVTFDRDFARLLGMGRAMLLSTRGTS